MVRYVNQTQPFWRRNGGRDHFYFVTNDWGVCRCAAVWGVGWGWGGVGGWGVGGLERPLPAPSRRYPEWPEVQNPIRITHFGYHVDGPADNPWFRGRWRCYDAHKDVVAPPHDGGLLPPAGGAWPADTAEFLRSKRLLLLYTGWLDLDGVRGQVGAPAARGPGPGAALRAVCCAGC
jgi:hypothetical protein